MISNSFDIGFIINWFSGKKTLLRVKIKVLDTDVTPK